MLSLSCQYTEVCGPREYLSGVKIKNSGVKEQQWEEAVAKKNVIPNLQNRYLFGLFSVLSVLRAAVDIPLNIINVWKVSRTFLLLQFGQDRRLSLWKRRHLF